MTVASALRGHECLAVLEQLSPTLVDYVVELAWRRVESLELDFLEELELDISH